MGGVVALPGWEPSGGLCLTALLCTPTGHGSESQRNATLWGILNACSGRPFQAFSSDDPGRIYAFRGKQAGQGGGGSRQGKRCVPQRAAQPGSVVEEMGEFGLWP